MNDESLQRFVEQLADRAALDWDAAARELSPPQLRALRRIESIAAAYRSAAAIPAAGRFQRLVLRERIGGGFGGEVWRAHDPLLDRTVALKLRPAAPLEARQQARLLDEACLLARIDHPNVLRVLGAEVEHGRTGIWSEFVDGENLDERLQREGRFGGEEVGAIGSAMCGALAAVHQAGFAHGDVKPANLLRTREGRYVLCDLGSAVPLHPGGHPGPPLSGSPLYLAPEVLAGGRPSVASDLYALGATLFHLLAGTAPVVGANLDALLAAHRAGHRLHLRDRRPDLPARLVGAIERAIAPDPAQRPASAGAFEAALAAPPRSRSSLLAWIAAALAATVIAVLALRPPPPEPLAVEVHWLRGDTAAPLFDGAPVRRGDTLYLELRCARRCWAYVLAEDGAREVATLFPLPQTRANPLDPPATVRLPGSVAGTDRQWRIGAANGSEERLLLVVAPQALPALEQAGAGRAIADGSGDDDERFRGVDAIVPSAAARRSAGLEALASDLRATASPFAETHWLRLRRSDAGAAPAAR